MKRALPLLVAFLALAPAAHAAEPDIVFTAEPPELGASNDVTFAYTAGDSATFTCRLDDTEFPDCRSPRVYMDLADGAHVFTLRATDPTGTAEAIKRFTIDTVAPAAPVITTPAQDSAQNSKMVTLSGSAEPGADVVASEGADARGTAMADAGGACKVAIAGAPEGVHECTLRRARRTRSSTGACCPRAGACASISTPPASPRRRPLVIRTASRSLARPALRRRGASMLGVFEACASARQLSRARRRRASAERARRLLPLQTRARRPSIGFDELMYMPAATLDARADRDADRNADRGDCCDPRLSKMWCCARRPAHLGLAAGRRRLPEIRSRTAVAIGRWSM